MEYRSQKFEGYPAPKSCSLSFLLLCVAVAVRSALATDPAYYAQQRKSIESEYAENRAFADKARENALEFRDSAQADYKKQIEVCKEQIAGDQKREQEAQKAGDKTWLAELKGDITQQQKECQDLQDSISGAQSAYLKKLSDIAEELSRNTKWRDSQLASISAAERADASAKAKQSADQIQQGVSKLAQDINRAPDIDSRQTGRPNSDRPSSAEPSQTERVTPVTGNPLLGLMAKLISTADDADRSEPDARSEEAKPSSNVAVNEYLADKT